MAVLCSYCNEFSDDNNLCDNCGRHIKRDIGKWSITLNNKLSITTTLRDEDTSNCDNKYIEVPLFLDSGKAYFKYYQEISLMEYLKEQEINFKTMEFIVNRLGNIIKSINKKNKILGSMDLDQLWIFNNDLESLHLKQVRPYLSKGDSLKKYKCGRISATEVLYGHSKNIDYSTDVYILGRILLILALNGKVIENRAHETYLAYFITAFNEEIPLELHEWIYKTTTLFSEDRYKNVEDALKLFKIIYKNEENSFTNISFLYSSASDAGDYKRFRVKDKDEITREKANEDSYLVLEEKESNKIFAMIADGISTVSYGSGYDAANIVKENSIKTWEEKHNNLQTLYDVKSFFLSIINNSNNKINNSIIRDTSKALSGAVMGATFAAVIIIKDKMYFVSLGDSKIYIFNKKKGLNLLNYEENYGTELLIEGYSWGECNNIDGFNALTNCIGGNDISDNPKYVKEDELIVKEISLRNEDIILICSDGVTDYVNPIGYSNNLWNIDKILKEYIVTNEKLDNILEVPSNLIQIANENGGGDNITSIIIKVFLS